MLLSWPTPVLHFIRTTAQKCFSCHPPLPPPPPPRLPDHSASQCQWSDANADLQSARPGRQSRGSSYHSWWDNTVCEKMRSRDEHSLLGSCWRGSSEVQHHWFLEEGCALSEVLTGKLQWKWFGKKKVPAQTTQDRICDCFLDLVKDSLLCSLVFASSNGKCLVDERFADHRRVFSFPIAKQRTVKQSSVILSVKQSFEAFPCSACVTCRLHLG